MWPVAVCMCHGGLLPCVCAHFAPLSDRVRQTILQIFKCFGFLLCIVAFVLCSAVLFRLKHIIYRSAICALFLLLGSLKHLMFRASVLVVGTFQ